MKYLSGIRLKTVYFFFFCKSVIHSAYMLERFICVCGIHPDMQVLDKLFKEYILSTVKVA